MDRIGPTKRPSGNPRGYQTWKDLSFLHWRVSVDELCPLIPSELSIDTFDGHAWIGLVPFYMANVRPRMLPALPGLSWFCETNVRTYVHLNGENPGVWFFSLDAYNRIAVAIARKFWNLNYHYSKMVMSVDAGFAEYSGCRSNGAGRYDLRIEIQNAKTRAISHTAEPGSLEHFLAERYLLYTLDSQQKLLVGQVHHTPYPLRPAKTLISNQQLLSVNGIKKLGAPDHTLFSPGVDVEVFDLRSALNS